MDHPISNVHGNGMACKIMGVPRERFTPLENTFRHIRVHNNCTNVFVVQHNQTSKFVLDLLCIDEASSRVKEGKLLL